MSKNLDKYLFGPVPSRRLGLSLGVDIIPFKSCSQDCIYCQLGKSQCAQTIERKSYVDIYEVVDEIKRKLETGVKADYITISGSGEPTLNSDIGLLIDEIKKLTDVPVAVITNGSLLYLWEVRDAVSRADLIVPSLDAFDQESFEKINRPHKDISFERLVEGLKLLKKEYYGPVWLEVFLVDGLNTNDEDVKKLKSIIDSIGPDKIQLNTAVRPTAEFGLKPVSGEGLREIAEFLGERAEVIVDYEKLGERINELEGSIDSIYQMLKRRPCSIDDIGVSLGINRNEVLKSITILQNEGKILSEAVGDKVYYRVSS